MTIQSCNKPLLIMGDLNCNQKVWEGSCNSSNGRIIHQSLEDQGLTFLNDGTSTRFTTANKRKSVVDMCLISKDLTEKTSWSTIPDCGASDHFPTICKLNDFSNDVQAT